MLASGTRAAWRLHVGEALGGRRLKLLPQQEQAEVVKMVTGGRKRAAEMKPELNVHPATIAVAPDKSVELTMTKSEHWMALQKVISSSQREAGWKQESDR